MPSWPLPRLHPSYFDARERRAHREAARVSRIPLSIVAACAAAGRWTCSASSAQGEHRAQPRGGQGDRRPRRDAACPGARTAWRRTRLPGVREHKIETLESSCPGRPLTACAGNSGAVRHVPRSLRSGRYRGPTKTSAACSEDGREDRRDAARGIVRACAAVRAAVSERRRTPLARDLPPQGRGSRPEPAPRRCSRSARPACTT